MQWHNFNQDNKREKDNLQHLYLNKGSLKTQSKYKWQEERTLKNVVVVTLR